MLPQSLMIKSCEHKPWVVRTGYLSTVGHDAKKWQHTRPSGALQICAFLIFPTLVDFPSHSRKSRQDHHWSSHQCWSFPCQNDRNIACNFLWDSACSACSSPFCPSSHSETVTSIFSAQRSFTSAIKGYMCSFFALDLCDVLDSASQQNTMVTWRSDTALFTGTGCVCKKP